MSSGHGFFGSDCSEKRGNPETTATTTRQKANTPISVQSLLPPLSAAMSATPPPRHTLPLALIFCTKSTR